MGMMRVEDKWSNNTSRIKRGSYYALWPGGAGPSPKREAQHVFVTRCGCPLIAAQELAATGGFRPSFDLDLCCDEPILRNSALSSREKSTALRRAYEHGGN